MRRLTRWMSAALIILVFAGLCLALARPGSRAASNDPPTRGEFMRQKLEFAKNVLEGLSLERYESVERNAKALRRLSQAAEWEVPTIPNATDYVALTTEFQRYADDLARNAKDRNIDGATLAYVKLTMNCVQCHKYVRFASK